MPWSEGEAEILGQTLGLRDAIGVWDAESVDILASQDCQLLLIEVPTVVTLLATALVAFGMACAWYRFGFTFVSPEDVSPIADTMGESRSRKEALPRGSERAED